MNKNVYDVFRTVAKKRATCFDTRSAAFITQGKLSKDIFHKRKNKIIKAGLVYQYKEGPDEAIVYTFKNDDLRKGDYFVHDHTDYLVFEDQKLVDDGVNHKKHRAVECNVSFSFQGIIFKGFYLSTLRRKTDRDLEGKQLLMPDEMPLLILPKNENLTVNSVFFIDEKPWRIVEFDSITNKGITYYYLERDFTRNLSEEEEIEIQSFSFITEEEFTQEPEPMFMPFSFEPEGSQEVALRPLTDYYFTTEEGYFSATPKVDVVSREKTKINFQIPLGISEVSISTRLNGVNLEKIYKVVL